MGGIQLWELSSYGSCLPMGDVKLGGGIQSGGVSSNWRCPVKISVQLC